MMGKIRKALSSRDMLSLNNNTKTIKNTFSKYDFNKYVVAEKDGTQFIVVYKFARTLRGSNIDNKSDKIAEIRTELQEELDCKIGYTLDYDRAVIQIDPNHPKYFIYPYTQYFNIDKKQIDKMFQACITYSDYSQTPALDCATIVSKFVSQESPYQTLSNEEELDYSRLVNYSLDDLTVLSVANGFTVDRTTTDCLSLYYDSTVQNPFSDLEELREEAWKLGYRIGYDITPDCNQIYIHVDPDHPMSYLTPLSKYHNATEHYVDTLQLATDFDETFDIQDPYYDAIVIYALVMDSKRTELWFDIIERFEDGVDRQKLEDRYDDVRNNIAVF